MKLAVLGGSGGVGRHVLTEAVERGHDVVAVLRPATTHEAPAAVRVVRAELGEAVFRGVFEGREAVISSLGMRRRDPRNPFTPILGPHDFNSATARAIVAAMRAAGVPRVVAVSAAGVADSAPRMNLVMRLLVAWSSIGVAYRDLAVMEAVFAESGLDWCCPRPVTLVNGPPTGRVREVGHFGATMTIRRADVARYLLDRAEGAPGDRVAQIANG